MLESVTPRKVQSAVRAGYERLRTYRKARAMFIREYVGQYYRKEFGMTGDEPINLLFSAIRAVVPHIINRNPACKVETDYGQEYEMYAELQSLGIDKTFRDMDIKSILRSGAVDAMFAMGIAKVGLSASGSMLNIEGNTIDPGQIYISMVDLDDFIMDSTCRQRNESGFLGHRVPVSRQLLLDNDMYDHDAVMKLPSIADRIKSERRASSITEYRGGEASMHELQDKVSVAELWVPNANALVTVPDPADGVITDKYLGITDYFGPKTGPFSFLSLTPPVGGNPLPVAPVSLYYDLHKAANRLAVKTMEQADGQRDILLVRPTHTDVGQAIMSADNGDAIVTDDPKAVNQISLGGASKDSGAFLGTLYGWFNEMSGRPNLMSGGAADADSATEAQHMYSNASISVEDAKDLIYQWTADIASKVAWYLHTDPLIDITLAKRKPGGEKEVVQLTPEQRVGDWHDYYFKIKPKSMGKLDPAIRAKRVVEFITKILPSIMQTSMFAMQMGIQFNTTAAITKAAEDLDIGDDIQDLLVDPEFQQKIAMRMLLGPQQSGKGNMSTTGFMQNGQSPSIPATTTPQQDFNQQAQSGSADAQSQNFGVM